MAKKIIPSYIVATNRDWSLIARLPYAIHTVNFGSEMMQAKYVSGKTIFCSMNEFLKSFIRADLNCTIYASRMGRLACASQVATRKANVQFQKFFFPCFCIHSQSKIYFFQRHVLPNQFLSKNSRCVPFGHKIRSKNDKWVH